MASPTTHRTEHTVTVSAPAAAVFDLIADVSRWPCVFGPTVQVDYLERTEDAELLRIWAFANGEVRTWTSRRSLDRGSGRIAFRQVASSPPVAGMGGEWCLRPLDEDTTRVVLRHDFQAVHDEPRDVEWISRATDHNSTAELAALRRAAELGDRLAGLVVAFEDRILVNGSAERTYDFVYRADRWPERIPHVARLVLTEGTANLQVMEMDTRGADGSTHTTRSVRVCFPPTRIVYKQVQPPAIMSAHTGEWTFHQVSDGVVATSRHTAVIRPEAVASVLGPGATVDQARVAVRQALGANSLATLRRARDFAEQTGC